MTEGGGGSEGSARVRAGRGGGVHWTLTGVGELVVLVRLAVQELDLQRGLESERGRKTPPRAQQTGRGKTPFFRKGHEHFGGREKSVLTVSKSTGSFFA